MRRSGRRGNVGPNRAATPGPGRTVPQPGAERRPRGTRGHAGGRRGAGSRCGRGRDGGRRKGPGTNGRRGAVRGHNGRGGRGGPGLNAREGEGRRGERPGGHRWGRKRGGGGAAPTGSAGRNEGPDPVPARGAPKLGPPRRTRRAAQRSPRTHPLSRAPAALGLLHGAGWAAGS